MGQRVISAPEGSKEDEIAISGRGIASANSTPTTTEKISDNDRTETPKLADESLPEPLFTAAPTHYSIGARMIYWISSALLSFLLLFVVVSFAMVKTVPSIVWVLSSWMQFKDPNRLRPFFAEEKRRKRLPTGKLKCDIGYYARREGLECEEMKVETEDGFILTIQHIVDPKDRETDLKKKYPVLLWPGLMQSSGAFCVNDDRSLAFFLCKSGYDVWLANNRGYFRPQHKTLKPSNPKFWAWTLGDMGQYDHPAVINYVRNRTGRKKIALVAHSQGTSLTFLTLAKGQLPSLGHNLSVFVALAPAVFEGTLLNRFQFSWVKFMSPRTYRCFFGINSFIPLMMMMHAILPGRLYGWLGYRVFNYLFSWTDLRWEARLRNRFFQFSPVYISSDAMRWWLGNDGFAKWRCILRVDDEPWYQPGTMPPVSLYVGGKDQLVDGRKLIERLERVEKDVLLIRSQIDEDYEHLDCIWSMDCIDQVGRNVREDIWFTVPAEEDVITPQGCQPQEKGKLICKEIYHGS